MNNTSQIVDFKEIVEGIFKTYVPAALEAGTFKAVPKAIVVGKGLDNVAVAIKKGIEGEVSAGKLVVEL